jgi:hypothetical protein
MTDPTRITLQRDHNNGRFIDVGRLDPVLDRLLYIIDIAADTDVGGEDMLLRARSEYEGLTPAVLTALRAMVDLFEGGTEDGDEIRWKGSPDTQYYDSPTGDYAIDPALVRWFLSSVKRVQREHEALAAAAPEAN